MEAVTHIRAYLAGTITLRINVSSHQKNLLVGYVDSDYANCEDIRRSTTSFIFFLKGTPISRKSTRQNLMTNSTCEAEYVAACEATKEANWLRNILLHLNVGVKRGAVPLFIDNRVAGLLAQNPIHHDRTKHIDIKFHSIRERVLLGETEICEISSKDNIADLLTKTLPATTFTGLREKPVIREGRK